MKFIIVSNSIHWTSTRFRPFDGFFVDPETLYFNSKLREEAILNFMLSVLKYLWSFLPCFKSEAAFSREIMMLPPLKLSIFSTL